MRRRHAVCARYPEQTARHRRVILKAKLAGGRAGCGPGAPGAGRPAGVAPRHAGRITAALKEWLRPQPACRGSPAVRSLPSVARPIRPASYRQPGALARGHAPLSVAARGEVAAQSHAVRIGQVGVTARACAASSSFRAASSSCGALYITELCNPAPGASVFGFVAARLNGPAPVRGRHAARRITRDGQRAARRPHAAPVPMSRHARPSTDAAAAEGAAAPHIPR